MSSDSTEIVTFFVISDSAGETATKSVQTTMAQYPTVEFSLFRRTFATDEKALRQALQDVSEEKAPVLHTLVNQELIEIIRSFCEEHQLFSFDMMTPPILEIERLTGIKPVRQPSTPHLLNESHFKRIKAMGFTVKYDGGKNPRDFLEAGVVLLDVSRTSKTPLSLFLVSKNLKVTNLPLIPQAHIPKQLQEVNPKKIVGLTNNPDISSNTRKEQMHSYGLNPNTTYSDIEKIRAELDFANDLYEKLGCAVISVASLSIKETAPFILSALDLEDHSYYGAETTDKND